MEWWTQYTTEKEGNDYIATHYFSGGFTVVPTVLLTSNVRNLVHEFWIPSVVEITTNLAKMNISNSYPHNVYGFAIGY